MLTGRHGIEHAAAREALLATARFRGLDAVPLSPAVDNLISLRRQAYAAHRTSLGPDGAFLPAEFSEVVHAVITFADPLAVSAPEEATWHPIPRSWSYRNGLPAPVETRRLA
jgi:hypothetical protein